LQEAGERGMERFSSVVMTILWKDNDKEEEIITMKMMKKQVDDLQVYVCEVVTWMMCK
jgi:hypothetical protein